MKPLASIKAFIFDLDGTIVNFSINWAQVKEKIKKILGTNHSLTPLIPSLEELVTDSEMKKRIYKLIDNEEMKAVKTLKADEDIIKLFRQIKKLGYKIAIVTLQGRKPAVEALKRLEILENFDLIVSRNEEKTREGQVRIVLKTLGLHASQAIVVADKLMDMKVAEKLGCMSMAITDKPDVNGDFKAARIEEISKILEVS